MQMFSDLQFLVTKKDLKLLSAKKFGGGTDCRLLDCFLCNFSEGHWAQGTYVLRSKLRRMCYLVHESNNYRIEICSHKICVPRPRQLFSTLTEFSFTIWRVFNGAALKEFGRNFLIVSYGRNKQIVKSLEGKGGKLNKYK